MKRILTIIQAWRQRRERRSLERWEQIRAEGKKRFVVRTALTFGVLMVAWTDVVNVLLFAEIKPAISILKLIFSVLLGFFVGSSAWTDREAKYQKALRETRATALPDSTKLPTNRA
jgi:hypothetical protein